eukprot:Lithocolla_globosa_v1_NODE_255_length_4802_cov_69.795660.p5 type:complete len:117 gc:universal NODE_255_length_4802_cov_69.795660:492-142(-)
MIMLQLRYRPNNFSSHFVNPVSSSGTGPIQVFTNANSGTFPLSKLLKQEGHTKTSPFFITPSLSSSIPSKYLFSWRHSFSKTGLAKLSEFTPNNNSRDGKSFACTSFILYFSTFSA